MIISSALLAVWLAVVAMNQSTGEIFADSSLIGHKRLPRQERHLLIMEVTTRCVATTPCGTAKIAYMYERDAARFEFKGSACVSFTSIVEFFPALCSHSDRAVQHRPLHWMSTSDFGYMFGADSIFYPPQRVF